MLEDENNKHLSQEGPSAPKRKNIGGGDSTLCDDQKSVMSTGSSQLDVKVEHRHYWQLSLQAVHTELEVKSKLKVLATQSCPTLCNPMDCSPLGSSVHGILQARVLEQVATSSSMGSS